MTGMPSPHYIKYYSQYVHIFGTQLSYESTDYQFRVLKDCDSPDEALALLLLLKVTST